MKYFKKENIYTFDMNDARRYGIQFKHTPYSKLVMPQNVPIKQDAIFLGRAKNRMDEISKIYKQLKEKKVKTKFMVLGAKENEFTINKFMSYSDYLLELSASKSVVEINKADQAGCSLRLLESLFLKKKLITNNKYIKEDKYYNPKNVFILDIDNMDDIHNFLNSPYSNDISVDDLDFSVWIDTF